MHRTPETRFARLHHAAHEGATTTFVAAAPGFLPDEENHPVLAAVAAEDPERAARIKDGLHRLIAAEQEVMAWLEADPAHVTLLAHSPLEALRQALPDLEEGFFDGWLPAGAGGA